MTASRAVFPLIALRRLSTETITKSRHESHQKSYFSRNGRAGQFENTFLDVLAIKDPVAIAIALRTFSCHFYSRTHLFMDGAVQDLLDAREAATDGSLDSRLILKKVVSTSHNGPTSVPFEDIQVDLCS